MLIVARIVDDSNAAGDDARADQCIQKFNKRFEQGLLGQVLTNEVLRNQYRANI